MSNSKNKNHQGKLVVVEGIDGAGKSTLIRALREHFEDQGLSVTVSEWRESRIIGPYIKKLSDKQIKVCPRAFSSLHAADFADRLSRDILPALARGEVVICDRYLYTEIVRDYGLDLPTDWSVSLFPFAPEPDLILFLNASLNTSIRRIHKRMQNNGPAGSLNKSLRMELLGSLLGSLDSTTGMMVDGKYKENGDPMTDKDRDQIKFRFQTKTREKYHTIFASKKNVVTLDAEKSKSVVLDQAIAATGTLFSSKASRKR